MAEGEDTMLRAQLDAVSSLLLSVQKDCIAERKRADAAEKKLREARRALSRGCSRCGNMPDASAWTSPADPLGLWGKTK